YRRTVSTLSYTALAVAVLSSCLAVPMSAAAQPYPPSVEYSSSPKMSGRNMRRQELEEETFEQRAHAALERYRTVKKEIRTDLDLWYSMNTSVMSQWGVPGGGYGAVQAEFTPAVDWHAFRDAAWGTGSFQFSFLSAQYWSGATGISLASAIDVNGPINDKPFV